MSDDLRTRLHDADPARDLAPLPAMRRDALLERASTGSARRPGRRRLAIGALAATAAVAVGVALVPRSTPGPVLTLDLPATDPMAACAPLADFAVTALRRTDVALRGTVRSIEGGVATVRPDTVFRGGPAGEVRLRVASTEDGAVLRPGERVLIAAVDGQVQGCGLSAEESPQLLRYYDQAFIS